MQANERKKNVKQNAGVFDQTIREQTHFLMFRLFFHYKFNVLWKNKKKKSEGKSNKIDVIFNGK